MIFLRFSNTKFYPYILYIRKLFTKILHRLLLIGVANLTYASPTYRKILYRTTYTCSASNHLPLERVIQVLVFVLYPIFLKSKCHLTSLFVWPIVWLFLKLALTIKISPCRQSILWRYIKKNSRQFGKTLKVIMNNASRILKMNHKAQLRQETGQIRIRRTSPTSLLSSTNIPVHIYIVLPLQYTNSGTYTRSFPIGFKSRYPS